MNVWRPHLRPARMAGAQLGRGLVDGLGRPGRVGIPSSGQYLVHIVGDLGSKAIIDRPERGDDVPVARDLECRGEVDSLVGQLRGTGERLAGGEKGEVRAW